MNFFFSFRISHSIFIFFLWRALFISFCASCFISRFRYYSLFSLNFIDDDDDKKMSEKCTRKKLSQLNTLLHLKMSLFSALHTDFFHSSSILSLSHTHTLIRCCWKSPITQQTGEKREREKKNMRRGDMLCRLNNRPIYLVENLYRTFVLFYIKSKSFVKRFSFFILSISLGWFFTHIYICAKPLIILSDFLSFTYSLRIFFSIK